MKANYSKILPFVLMVILTLSFTGCGKKEEKAAASEKPTQEGTKETLQVKPGDEVLAPFFDAHMFSGKWAPAKIVTPASDETKSEYEVEFMIGTPDLEEGEKRFVKDVVWKSHPAKKDELKIGMIVITTGDNPEDPSEAWTDTWRKAVISDIKHNAIEVEFFNDYKKDSDGKEERFLHNVYIIDAPDVKEPGE